MQDQNVESRCIDEKLLIDLIHKGLLRLITKPEEACIQRTPKEADK